MLTVLKIFLHINYCPGMRIAHIASELAPIAKVGGLGDVVYGLANEQQKNGDEPVVFLPNYSSIDHAIDLPFSVKLLGNYDQIYGDGEVERFKKFCLQALEEIRRENLDIIHLHDWPTALIAPLYQGDTPIVLSIHNFNHQGSCDSKCLEGLELDNMECPNTAGNINILKGGLIYSDAIVAVSPGYAKEILTKQEGAGLDQVLKKYQNKFSGILNGIDTDYWSPATDPFLAHTYTPQTYIGGKRKNRATLELGPSDKPLVCAITRLVPQKGLDMIEHALEFTLKEGNQFILLGSSPCPKTQKRFQGLAKKHHGPNLYCHFTFDERLAHRVYAASDLIVIPSLFEPCGLTQMIAMRYSTIPVVRKTGGLANTVFDDKNGYTFFDPTTDAFEEALSRAFKTHSTWPNLIKNAQSTDFSWNISAKQYQDIYFSLKK